jgi:hypothetical protein
MQAGAQLMTFTTLIIGPQPLIATTQPGSRPPSRAS